MKTISRTGLFAILFLALIFSSCQNETIQETPNDPQENISEGSDLLIYLRSSTSSETNNNIEDDCVDFEFPITFLVYDADWEIMQTIVAESDQDIWNVLDMIDESTYVSINYPVTLIYQNEVILTVNNNQELLEAFETYDGGCYDLEVLFGCAIDALTVIDVEIQDDVSPTDGITTFSLDLEFFCNDIEFDLQYFETTQDAESQTNLITFPYTNNTNPQTIYVVATTEYEGVVVNSNVFEINVIIVDSETNVDCNEWDLNGKWLPLGGDNTVEPNTMYIFEDGLRYTVYCTENCDWEALGIEDAIPTPLEYIYDYENCLLTTDLNFGNYVTWSTQFVCDEQVLRAYVVETGAEIIFYRPGYDISQCDE
jgi:hypothetical protein